MDYGLLGSAIGAATFGAGRELAAAAARGLVTRVERGVTFAAALSKAASQAAASPRAGPEPGAQHASGASGTTSDSVATAQVAEQLATLRARILRALAAAGIVLEQPAELMLDHQDRIAVAGWHPQGIEIEEVLARDELLRRDFIRLARKIGDQPEDSFVASWFALTLPAGLAVDLG